MPDAHPRIVISGYYGCGNTGDEAVLAGILESFKQKRVTAQFTVLSADPKDTQKRHNIRAVDRMRLPGLIAELRKCDLLISGGGSLLQDTTSLRSLLYYLAVPWLARQLGRKVMFYAQGIGPLQSSFSRRITAKLANRVQFITVRDDESAQLLRDIGVHIPTVETTADPAFAITPLSSDRTQDLLTRLQNAGNGPLLGLALRPWIDGPDSAEWTGIAAELAERTGGHLVLIPMQPPGDTLLGQEIASALGDRATLITSEFSPSEMLDIIRKLDVLVAMRLHALIFGARMGIPLVALDYDPKVTGLMHRLGMQKSCILIKSAKVETVCTLVKDALNSSDIIGPLYREKSNELANLALINVDRALSLCK